MKTNQILFFLIVCSDKHSASSIFCDILLQTMHIKLQLLFSTTCFVEQINEEEVRNWLFGKDIYLQI